MDHARVAEMLECWACGRVRVTRPADSYCAGSAEGRHVAEAGEIFDGDLRATQPRISDDLGLRVERAVIAAGRLFAIALTLYQSSACRCTRSRAGCACATLAECSTRRTPRLPPAAVIPCTECVPRFAVLARGV